MKKLTVACYVFNTAMLIWVVVAFITPYTGGNTYANMGGAIADRIANMMLIAGWVAGNIIFGLILVIAKKR